MLYSEFMSETGAPDNMMSYVVYTGLNRIYMGKAAMMRITGRSRIKKGSRRQ